MAKTVFCKTLLRVFMVFALFMQALIPVGFMPVFADNGQIQIVICSGDSEKTISINQNESVPHSDSHQYEPCAYIFSPNFANDTVINEQKQIFTDFVLSNTLTQIWYDFNGRDGHQSRAPPLLS